MVRSPPVREMFSSSTDSIIISMLIFKDYYCIGRGTSYFCLFCRVSWRVGGLSKKLGLDLSLLRSLKRMEAREDEGW